MCPGDLDVVVEEPHERHDQDAAPHDHRLRREHQVAPEVSHEPPDERCRDDGDAAHGGRALLGQVVLGAMIGLAQDRLALAAVAEERDQPAGREQRDHHGGGTRDHDGDHERPCSNSRTTTRSSNGTTVSPMVCVASWPLPATSTTSPLTAICSATAMAFLRSGSITTFVR